MSAYEAATVELLSSCSLYEVISVQLMQFETQTGKLPVLAVLDRSLLPAALRAFGLTEAFKRPEPIVLYVDTARVMFAKLPDGEYMNTMGAAHSNKLVL